MLTYLQFGLSIVRNTTSKFDLMVNDAMRIFNKTRWCHNSLWVSLMPTALPPLICRGWWQLLLPPIHIKLPYVMNAPPPWTINVDAAPWRVLDMLFMRNCLITIYCAQRYASASSDVRMNCTYQFWYASSEAPLLYRRGVLLNKRKPVSSRSLPLVTTLLQIDV